MSIDSTESKCSTHNTYAMAQTGLTSCGACPRVVGDGIAMAPPGIVSIDDGPGRHDVLSVHAGNAARTYDDVHVGLPPIAMPTSRRPCCEDHNRSCGCTRTAERGFSNLRRFLTGAACHRLPGAPPWPPPLYPLHAPFDLTVFPDCATAGDPAVFVFLSEEIVWLLTTLSSVV